MRLPEALRSCSTGLLRRIAAHHGIAVSETSLRQELIDQLVATLRDAAHLEAVIARLPPGALRLLQVVAARGGMVRAVEVDRWLAVQQDPGSLTSLLDRGLLYVTFVVEGPLRGKVYAVPAEVLDRVSPSDGPLIDLALGPTPERVLRCDPTLDLLRILTLLRGGSRTMREVERALAPAPPELLWPPHARWRFLLQVLAAGGAVLALGARWMARPGVSNVLRLSRSEAVRWLWGVVERAPQTLLGPERRQWTGADREVALTSGRRALYVLAQVPTGRWVTRASLLRAVDAEGGEPSGAEAPRERDAWDRTAPVEGILAGPCRWLGLVEWSLDGKSLVLTDVGRALLDERPVPLPPTFDAVVHVEQGGPKVARLSLRQVWDLALFAAVHVEEERVVVRLTPASVLDGIARGGDRRDLEQVLDQLDGDAGRPGRDAVQGWLEGLGGVEIVPGLLLRGASSEVVDDVLQRVGGQWERLSPTLAATSLDRWRHLAQTLRSMGRAARVRPGTAALLRPSESEMALLAIYLAQLTDPEVLVGRSFETFLHRLESLVSMERRDELARRALEIAGRGARRPP